MTQLTESLSWPGTYSVLSLFVVGRAEVVSRPPQGRPDARIKSFRLEDADRVLGGREVYEHDAQFEVLPDDLGSVVRSWLEGAVQGGAEVAWFGFEGSFDFEELLTREAAPSLYGVADRTGIYLALNDGDRESSEWAEQVQACRGRLFWTRSST